MRFLSYYAHPFVRMPWWPDPHGSGDSGHLLREEKNERDANQTFELNGPFFFPRQRPKKSHEFAVVGIEMGEIKTVRLLSSSELWLTWIHISSSNSNLANIGRLETNANGSHFYLHYHTNRLYIYIYIINYFWAKGRKFFLLRIFVWAV